MEWLGVPDFHRTDETAWTANILDNCSSWWGGGTTTNQNWVSQYGGASGSVSVLWNCPICVLPVYCRRVLENTRAATRRVPNNHLGINCLARMRIPSNSRNPIRNWQVNQRDDDWGGLVDQ